ncbi:MAG: hypothetical protein AAB496_01200 [Patescibacteria group bacterium]
MTEDSKNINNSGWRDPDNENKNRWQIYFSKVSRWGIKAFWLLMAAMVILIGISGFYIYQYLSTDSEITLSVLAPKEIMTGVPFDIAVNFNNNSKNVLGNATLSIFLPENTLILGDNSNKRVIIREIGAIESSSGFQNKIPILIFNDAPTVKNFNILVSYSSTLKTRFEKSQSVEVSVKEAGIKIDLVSPEKILNNEEFEIVANYANISEFDFSGVQMDLTFPRGFILKKSIAEGLKLSGNSLAIGNLSKGENGTLSIFGTIIGDEGSFFDIKSQIKANYADKTYLIGEKTANLSIAPSPLSLKINLNNSTDYSAFPADTLKYELIYSNNTDIGLNNVIVKTKLNGEMFDFSSLKSEAAFNSRNNTLVWNASNISQLRLLGSGESGSAVFEIKTKENYPISRLSDKNFILNVEGEISSPTIPYGVVSDTTIGLASLKTKVRGQISLESYVYFRDATGIVNKGQLPLKVNKPTNFTVHWIIKNYATDVKDAVVKAYLAPGVKFTGIVKSSIEITPQYDERTQEVSWLIPKILATKGIVGKAMEAVFQIEALPNITQIGQKMPLVGQSSISAVDEFVGAELNSVAEALATDFLKDSGFNPQIGEVIP